MTDVDVYVGFALIFLSSLVILIGLVVTAVSEFEESEN